MIDSFGRKHDYLRISLTDKCNLRCTYCMPEDGIPLQKSSKYMTREEVFAVAKEFVSLGVKKIRLTGGEPMVRKDFGSILKDLSTLRVDLTLTTNAVFAHAFIDDMKEAGIKSLNVSLDSLKRDRFFEITRRDDYNRVIENIRLLKQKFKVKLNVVLMKGVNDDEIIDFVKFASSEQIEVRFIEFMPFTGNSWDRSQTVTKQEVLDSVMNYFPNDGLTELASNKNDTSKMYHLSDLNAKFGVISTVSNPFCDSCNRLRLTADGKLKNCLFSGGETDLLKAHRNGQSLETLIFSSLKNKKKGLGGLDSLNNQTVKDLSNRPMISIGG